MINETSQHAYKLVSSLKCFFYSKTQQKIIIVSATSDLSCFIRLYQIKTTLTQTAQTCNSQTICWGQCDNYMTCREFNENQIITFQPRAKSVWKSLQFSHLHFFLMIHEQQYSVCATTKSVHFIMKSQLINISILDSYTSTTFNKIERLFILRLF